MIYKERTNKKIWNIIQGQQISLHCVRLWTHRQIICNCMQTHVEATRNWMVVTQFHFASLQARTYTLSEFDSASHISSAKQNYNCYDFCIPGCILCPALVSIALFVCAQIWKPINRILLQSKKGSAWRWRKPQHCVQCVCLSETKLCSINSKYGVHQYRQQTGTDFMVLFLLWCCQFMSQVGRWFMPRWFEIDLYSLICLLWEIMILNVMYIQKALAYLGF